MKHPKSVRNVCLAGHIHHGKTMLMDILIQQTHIKDWNLERNYRWLDTRIDEQEKLISMKAAPMSLLLPDSKGKSYFVNFIDTPGHSNFWGEVSCGLRVTDGVILVVDAVEGVMMMTQRIIKQAIRERLPIIVFVSKIDRLILELKIPPKDAYIKLKHTLEEINAIIQSVSTELGVDKSKYIVSPLLNNVLFGSGEYSFIFSLDSFSRIYSRQFKSVDPHKLKAVLWGDYFYDSQNRKFLKKSTENSNTRTFVEFVLEPIYKIFSHVVGKDKPDL